MKQNDTPKTVYLKDYKRPVFLIDTVDLEFDLEPEKTRVKSTLKLRRNPDYNPNNSRGSLETLVLDGEELDLLGVCLDGVALSPEQYEQAATQLSIFSVPNECIVQIENEIKPINNTSLEGLYVSSGNFCTQCEAQGFRKITYYLDRPDVMARFSATIRARKAEYPVLLCNGNQIDAGELTEGRHWVRWEDPFPKPCYLFALVAGDLVAVQDTFITQSGQEVALSIYVQAHNQDKCAHAMRSLKNAMRWDEEQYGLSYDLDNYMIVAVDDFNMGAMENKGLNIFNSKYVLAKPDTATDIDYQHIEGIIGHEYFHNWTGNRVTCRDWFQLSLKEGLTVFRDQEFSADMSARAVKRIEDVRLLRTIQFAEDAGPMAHPIRPDSYIEINNFYTVTVYEKGAEVIRMQHTLLGEAGFRKGMDLYFQRHDGQAVTTEDFVSAMEDANNADLQQFRYWYAQAGTPLLTVESQYDAASQRYTLHMQQSCPATPGQADKHAMHIPISLGLLDPAGQALPLQTSDGQQAEDTLVLSLTEAQQTFVFEGLSVEPVPSLLRGFSAPVRLHYAYSNSDLRLLMAHDSDSFVRWDASQQYAMRILEGLIANHQNQQPLVVEAEFIEACHDLLDAEHQDQALIAEALTLPSERYIAEQVERVDAEAIHVAREFLMSSIGQALKPVLRLRYEELLDDSPYQASPVAIGQRRLKNLCLTYLMQSADTTNIELVVRQYRQANNMTDKIIALSLLVEVGGELANDVLADFYKQYRDDTLVLDKWFAIQATSKRPDTLSQVKRLMQHPAFSLKNPNKVRALLGAFCMSNQSRFHARSGEGYTFLADCVLQLDSLNPQVAARMISAFNVWRRYAEPQQGLMRAQLQRIEQHKGLSPDVYEIVSKSLQ